jgi:hypothetical protein
MKRMTKHLFGPALGAALSLLSLSALAGEGLAAKPADLPAAARASLLKDIAAARASHPEAFAAVLDVKGVKPEVYKSFRNPQPNAAAELRALGPAALLPMLSALAFDGARPGLSDKERTALTAGLLEAVGVLRDPRSAPVLRAALESGTKDAVVLRSAAEAMGRLCGDAELASLVKHTAAGDDLREAAIHGLGQCKRAEGAKQLAAILGSGPDAATAEIVAYSLGLAGSSWGWKALGPSAEAQGLAVREIAARALFAAYPSYSGETRAIIERAILMVEHPLSSTLLGEARRGASPEVDAALVALQKRLDRQMKP